jgi:hypothetical protein
MSQENVEIAERGVAALNETYRTGDMRPWRRHVEETFDPDVLLEAEEAFTEGEWRGHAGAVGFVANQMEVLDDMWLRVDDYVHVDDDCLVAAITFRWAGTAHWPRSRTASAPCLHAARWKGRPVAGLFGTRAGPRSRRAVGVGDVAGETWMEAARGPYTRFPRRRGQVPQ